MKTHLPTLKELRQSIRMVQYSGYCLACGTEHYGFEPDSSGELCEECGAEEVYGAEELLIMGKYTETKR